MPPKRFIKAKINPKSAVPKARKAPSSTKFSKPKAKSSAKFAKPKAKSATHNYTKQYRYVKAKSYSSASPRQTAQPRTDVVTTDAGSTSSDRVTIYVLSLANGKFYVGKTSRPNVDKRLEEHKSGNGSVWTKLHQPLGLVEIVHNADPFDEDKITKKYMLKHDIANVRGGSYSRVELLQAEVDAISQQLRGSTDQCFLCGRSGHFASRCSTKYALRGDVQMTEATLLLECFRCARDGHDTESCYAKNHKNGANWCLRCGREGHEEQSCYAKTHTVLGEIVEPEGVGSSDEEEEEEKKQSGEKLPSQQCQRCGRWGHTADSCFAKTHSAGANRCLRCGRDGHDQSSCYAKTHTTGGALKEKRSGPKQFSRGWKGKPTGG